MSSPADSQSTDSLNSRAQVQRSRADAAGQGHSLRFWDELDEAGQTQLIEQLEAVDYELLSKLGGPPPLGPSATKCSLRAKSAS
jgi:hypothetical protein